ncbi:uncharacterized protein LOC110828780 [Zootermopsis nevadensis]|uniref:uncharacterized protein LOC110828780 n=1 Tax=Zootermopsis nevadensis TaxID=136037 RepID=UPI000B8E44F0|nr:uncharacterized protein LOC110828780 [Zootermopsis nevadensis]
MAILQSCCCWRSVRTGSYASAIYTTAYFSVTVVIMAHFVYSEHLYWSGNQTQPLSNSFLEPEVISPTSMIFNVVLLCSSGCGVLSSLLLIYGIYRDQRVFLVPWILTVLLTLCLDLTHSVYIFVLHSTKFNPLTAIVFTLDFFLLCLNVYSLLCVISQYQEYKAGRGTADNDAFLGCKAPQVRYAPRATATSCLSTRRAATYHETTQSPTALHSTLLLPEDTSRSQRPSLKHVQFPDDSRKGEALPSNQTSEVEADNGGVVLVIEEPWSTAEGKAPSIRSPGVDTAPLIDSVPQNECAVTWNK